MNAFFARLHIARQEFGLLIDLLNDAVEDLLRKRVDADLRFLAELHAPEGWRTLPSASRIPLADSIRPAE